MYKGFCQDRLGIYRQAEKSYAAAVEIWPGDYPLLYLGKTQARLGQWEAATDSKNRLADFFERESTNSNRQFLLKLEGELARHQGDLSGAAAYLQQCLPNYMFNLDARYALGRIFLEQGETELAGENFQFIVEHRYSAFLEGVGFLWPLAEYQLGKVAEMEGNLDEAVGRFEEFVRIWSAADVGLAELQDARQRLDRLKAGG